MLVERGTALLEVLDLESVERTAGILVGPDLSVVGLIDLAVVCVARGLRVLEVNADL